MGCPNWKENQNQIIDGKHEESGYGIIMAAHVGCGTWKRKCPNWKENQNQIIDGKHEESGYGIIMAAHVGCGTWKRKFSFLPDDVSGVDVNWSRCFVDNCQLMHEAKFCIPESETWESLPVSTVFSSITDATECIRGSYRVFLWQICCGSLCKYMMVASGRASFLCNEIRCRNKLRFGIMLLV